MLPADFQVRHSVITLPDSAVPLFSKMPLSMFQNQQVLALVHPDHADYPNFPSDPHTGMPS